jgi:hypothetical protein
VFDNNSEGNHDLQLATVKISWIFNLKNYTLELPLTQEIVPKQYAALKALPRTVTDSEARLCLAW